MRSGISFFNPTLFNKNIQRTWPIWGLYSLFLFIMLPVRILTPQYSMDYGETVQKLVTRMMTELPRMLTGLVPVAFVMGVVCAMAVFHYLFQSRSANLFHALPMRRETLFITSYLSGLCVFLIPNIVIGIAAIASGLIYGVLLPGPVIVLLACLTGATIFFYSFGAFCAMFTGNMIALPVFYGILNILALGVTMLVDGVCRTFLLGYQGFSDGMSRFVLWLTPVARMMRGTVFEKDYTVVVDIRIFGIYAAVGAFLSLIALWVYRRRNVETAGDAVCVSLVKPVFRFGVCFCSALFFGSLTCSIIGALDQGTLWIASILWGIIGYFLAEMVLRKSVRVLGAWKGCLIATGLVCVFYGCLAFDLVGFESRVPDPAQIESVQIDGFPSYPGRLYNAELSGEGSPEDVALFCEMHQAIIAQGEVEPSWVNDTDPKIAYGWISFTYQMKNGSTISRGYYISFCADEAQIPDTVTNLATRLLPSLERAVAGALRDELGTTSQSIAINQLWDGESQSVSSNKLMLNQREFQALLQAIHADLEAGNLVKEYLFAPQREADGQYATYLSFEWEEDHEQYQYYKHNYEELYLSKQAVQTLQVLQDLGVLSDTVHPLSWQQVERYYNGFILPETATAEDDAIEPEAEQLPQERA